MRTHLTVAVAALAALTAATPAPAAETPRRNVLLLIADDLGQDLGCCGNAKIKTPHLDALAKEGVRFTHGFATVSSCSPSRASLYTGLHTHQSGQYGLAHAAHNYNTRPEVKSLPGLLRPAGYRSGIIGKVHVLPKSVYSFDEEVTAGLAGNRDVAAMAKAARKFITDCGDKPFFLVMGYSDPHRSAKNFGNERTYDGVPETKYDPKDVVVPSHLPDQPEVRQDLAEYYQSVSRLDHGVGLVLDVLRETKTADSTLVIFLSDNGIPFPGAKTTLYDPGLNLPLIVRSPARKKHGLVNPAMVSWIDVAPTVLDWAGRKPEAAMTGRSFLPILEEEKPAGWDVVYGSHQCHEVTMYWPERMIRTRTHKYLLNLAHPLEFPTAADLYASPTWQGILKRGDDKMGVRSVKAYLNRPREELYDLEKDPHEVNNLADDPAHAATLKDLRARLRAWQEKTGDPWLVKYQHE
jgi:N-sulfoglucosamine sulfohydrolase